MGIKHSEHPRFPFAWTSGTENSRHSFEGCTGAFPLMLQGKSLHLHLTKKPHLRIIKKYSREKYFYTGDWSNGMIGVSKTFGGSSILSSLLLKEPEVL